MVMRSFMTLMFSRFVSALLPVTVLGRPSHSPQLPHQVMVQ